MNINYLTLRSFLEIAKHLNFSKSAHQLNISQPALSQKIKALEEELGVLLLNRSKNQVTLTKEGEFLYRTLVPSFTNIDSSFKHLQQFKSVPKPVLHIAATPSAAMSIVPTLIKRLKEQHPLLEFNILETLSSQALDYIKKGDFDMALIRTPLDISAEFQQPLRWRTVTRSPLSVAVAKEHIISGYNEVDLNELKEEDFLHYDPKTSSTLYYLMEYACMSAGFSPKIVAKGAEFMSRAVLISNGIGISIIPEDMIQLYSAYEIKAVPIKDISVMSSISMVWNESRDNDILRDARKVINESFPALISSAYNHI
ncbi:LysR family transcriptional regulator [Shouchella clausii]|uniref:LysR family transcriptional regulator n=1 Tax=Shouchella clausii TaxID=79880 RepID=A0A268NWK9_SHOCL|nr:LysR substrate-binding domain-containing protein [Shouchella clausii]PAE87917.1 LysR family transcriptional regulator [Shouchella clausii]